METIVDPGLQDLQWWEYVVQLIQYKKVSCFFFSQPTQVKLGPPPLGVVLL